MEGNDGRLYSVFRKAYETRGGRQVPGGAIGSVTLQPIGTRPKYTFAATRPFGEQLGLYLNQQGPGYDGLVGDGQGNLFGAAAKLQDDNDTVFRFVPNTLPQPGGPVSRLYTFKDKSGELFAITGVSLDGAGDILGTAAGGGIGSFPGHGGIFQLTPPADPSLTMYTETTLYLFTGGADGSDPQGRVVVGADGSLYGTTYSGGLGYGNGVVYRLTP